MIVTTTRWRNADDIQTRLRDVAPLLREAGATNIAFGRILTGENTGQAVTIVSYPDHATFGTASGKLAANAQYLKQHAEAVKSAVLLNRTLSLVDEVK
jgi:hypothetical protein